MGVPNVLVSIGYAPNDETLNRLHSVKPKYLAERRFYACRQQDDLLKYVNKGIDAGDYLGYAGNPEKSSGIFDARGLMKKSQIKKLRTLRKTVYRGNLSSPLTKPICLSTKSTPLRSILWRASQSEYENMRGCSSQLRRA